MSKKCRDCGEVKPLSEFHIAGKGRRESRCGPCSNERRRYQKLARMDIHEFGDHYQRAMKRIREKENGD